MNDSKQIRLKSGRNLAYIEYGDPKGKPLFYFHGWPGSRLSGLETDEAAKRVGVRVISPDRPGYGLSDYDPNRKLLDWPNDVLELAEKLIIKKFSVMGVSGGGPYAAVCAYKIPDKLFKTGIVVGLAEPYVKGLLDDIAFTAKIGWENYHRFPWTRTTSAWMAMIQFNYFSSIGQYFGFRSKVDQALLKTKLSKYMENTTKEAFRQGIKGPELDLKLYTDNWEFNLSDIKSKVFLWYGAQDKNVSLNMGMHYRDQIPGSKLYIDQEGGHLSRNKYEDKILEILVN